MQEENRDELTLKELILRLNYWLKYFLTYWKLILIGGILGGSIGLYKAFQSKPIYTAEMLFASEEKGGSNPYAGIASQFGLEIGGNGGTAFVGDNILELLKSRMLIEKTLLSMTIFDETELLLINRFIKFNELDQSWIKSPSMASVKFTENEPRENFGIKKDSILNRIGKSIRKNLEVNKLDKKLTIISLKFKSDDEVFAKKFVEVLVKNASEFYTETKTRKSKANIALLEKRIDSVRTALDAEVYGVAREKDQNMNPIRAQSTIQFGKKQMNVSILTSMYGELVKNLEASKFILMREEPLFLVIDKPILPLEMKKLGKTIGTIIGGFIGGSLILIYLIFIRVRKMVMHTPA